MKGVRIRLLLAVIAIAALGPAYSPLTAGAQEAGGVHIFGPNTKPYSISYEKWAMKWNRWLFGTGRQHSPILHAEECDRLRQPVNGVTFLPINFTAGFTTDCTVPEGNAVLLSPMGTICSPALGDPRWGLRRCAAATMTQIVQSLSVRINGEEVPHPRAYRVTTPRFTIRVPRDNFFETSARRVAAVTSGWHLMLRPLPEGTYNVRTRAVIDLPDADPFPVEFIYHLKVVDR